MRAVVLGISLGGAALAAAVALAGSAGGTAQVRIPLPALGSDEVKAVTLKATRANGKLSVRTTNNSRLGNESIVYVATQKGTTVTVYALVKRFGTARKAAGAGDDELSFAVIDSDAALREYGPVKSAGCRDLLEMNGVFERGRTGHSFGEDWALVSGRPSSVQSSDPEEVLDQIVDDVWGGCPGAPETYDDGPK